MSNTKLALIASTIAAVSFSQAAFAGDMSTKTDTAKTTVTVTSTANTAVLGTSTSAVRVTDENGNVFYNQYVPTTELQPVDVVDINAPSAETITFVHEGRTYVNKVVD